MVKPLSGHQGLPASKTLDLQGIFRSCKLGAAPLLGERAMAHQQKFHIESRGIKLHFLQFGDRGPHVLLIPGITSPAITWGFVAERLADHAQVVVLDNRARTSL